MDAHSYATAALKAGIPGKVNSERLGHAAVAFTLQTYTQVIPGMDQEAANVVADLIIGSAATPRGPISGPISFLEGSQGSKEPADRSPSPQVSGLCIQ